MHTLCKIQQVTIMLQMSSIFRINKCLLRNLQRAVRIPNDLSIVILVAEWTLLNCFFFITSGEFPMHSELGYGTIKFGDNEYAESYSDKKQEE